MLILPSQTKKVIVSLDNKKISTYLNKKSLLVWYVKSIEELEYIELKNNNKMTIKWELNIITHSQEEIKIVYSLFNGVVEISAIFNDQLSKLTELLDNIFIKYIDEVILKLKGVKHD